MIKEGSAGHYYVAASSWALAGKPDAAIRNLNKAIDKGWKDIEQLKKDENLKTLHKIKGWIELISKL